MKRPDPYHTATKGVESGAPAPRHAGNDRGTGWTLRKDMRPALLDAAEERFFAHGIARVSIEEIAAVVGCSKKTLYLHFRSKDHLVAAVLDRHMRQALQAYRSIRTSDLDRTQKLHAILMTIGQTFLPLAGRLRDDLRHSHPAILEEIEHLRSRTVFADLELLLNELTTQHSGAGTYRSIALPAFVGALTYLVESQKLQPKTTAAAETLHALASLTTAGLLGGMVPPLAQSTINPVTTSAQSKDEQ